MLSKINKKDLPYEKFIDFGAKALTDSELLSIMLRTGTKDIDVLSLSQKILERNNSVDGLLSLFDINYNELIKIKGVGKVKAIQILAFVELAKRLWKTSKIKSLLFTSPSLVSNYYMQEMKALKREELRLAILDTRQKLIKDILISRGTVNSSIFSVREILIESLRYGGVNIILIHNHPSGNPSPSKEDINVTSELKKACNLIGINLNDHIIIGDNTYYSFKEQGVL